VRRKWEIPKRVHRRLSGLIPANRNLISLPQHLW
jgi:hypothetical protein